VLFASVITRPESQTAAVALQIFATGTEGGAIPYYGQMMAAALVCAAPVVLLYLFLQKDLISGRYDRRRSEVTMTETVQWSLSGFADEIDADPRVQAAVMRALGASHIEVRGVWDTNILDLTEEQLAQLKAILDKAGLKASAIGSPIWKVDIALPVEHEVERLGRALRAAEVLGAPFIASSPSTSKERPPRKRGAQSSSG